MARVSIIVPVYNAEKTLHRCVDSILNQEYTDFELLLMDDGSTDDSASICDEYAQTDSRVKVIHKNNSGVSDTRNQALKLAGGTYLQFVDSDDWITPDATRIFVQTAEEKNCDLVIADFYRVVEERLSQKGDIDESAVMTREEFAGHMMKNPADFYYGVLWNKFYRRELVEKYQLRMNPEISWCEDFMFNLEYIRHAERFYAIQIPLCYYVKTKGSLVNQGISLSRTIKMKMMVFEYYNNFYKHVLDEEDYEKNRLQVYSFLIASAGDGMVPPLIFPNSKKLGDERMRIFTEAVEGDGLMMDSYRDRKLLEYYLKPVAIRFNLSLSEVKLLLCIMQVRQFRNREELADFAGISRNSLSKVLQRLVSKGMIKTEENRSKKERYQLNLSMLPAADPVFKDIFLAQKEYDRKRFAGFEEEDLIQYAALNERVKRNIQKVLQ